MYVIHLAQSDISKNKNIPETSLCSAKPPALVKEVRGGKVFFC